MLAVLVLLLLVFSGSTMEKYGPILLFPSRHSLAGASERSPVMTGNSLL